MTTSPSTPNEPSTGEVTRSLRAALTGIQYGRAADKRDWMVRLDR